MTIELFPAIDLRDGRCVRLLRGDYDAETVYGDDPAAMADTFVGAGATWIHVVDLDAARTGVQTQGPTIASIVARAGGARVQCGGGVRSVDAARALFDVGVSRVVVGTAAVEEPELVSAIAELGDVAVGLDVRGDEVALRGWVEGSGRSLTEVAGSLSSAGASAMIVTQISRDGTLEGPDLDTLRAALAATSVPIIASGGVGSAEHLRRLVDVIVDGRTLAGVIVGKALYEGEVSVAQALAALRPAAAGR